MAMLCQLQKLASFILDSSWVAKIYFVIIACPLPTEIRVIVILWRLISLSICSLLEIFSETHLYSLILIDWTYATNWSSTDLLNIALMHRRLEKRKAAVDLIEKEKY